MKNLNSSQVLAAAYIASGNMKSEAAQKVGVTPQTISSWMKEPVFVNTVESFKATLIYSARDRIRSLGIKAALTLSELMDSGCDASKLGAAKYVLDTINLTPGSGEEMGLWDNAFNSKSTPYLATEEVLNKLVKD
ncbi:MAG: hypothetical protein KC493_11285 [Bacteriovoracaceae bacterium]|nr:hypothetical protein [Bacteriovoracaceae bacterium]